MISHKKKVKLFQDKILKWFQENGRSFPWRKKGLNNYQVIISEILLQRTKAETVAKYYNDFLEKFPNWNSIASSNLKQLEDILMPLGLYKQRSYRLFKLASSIVDEGGKLPKNPDRVRELPMMGQYIANAYELFILKMKKPLIDVNMARVLERVFGERKLADIRYDPYLQKLAQDVINHPEVVSINWAILDLASLICKKKPRCEVCPLNKICLHYEKILKKVS